MASTSFVACSSRVSIRSAPCSSRTVVVRAEETDIYVGKGRYMKGDPKKYPTRNEWGVGGWAGGEAGLKKFLEENGSGDGKPMPSTGPATKLLGGKDIIYTGKGNYARDDKIKYPERSSTTGGFAGGERGVDKFVQDGDLSFAPEGEFRKQSSTLFIALGMAGTAVLITAIWLLLEPSVMGAIPKA